MHTQEKTIFLLRIHSCHVTRGTLSILLIVIIDGLIRPYKAHGGVMSQADIALVSDNFCGKNKLVRGK